MKSLVFSFIILFALPTIAQDVDNEQFKKDIDALYLSAKLGFKDSKSAEGKAMDDGSTRYESSLSLNGAKSYFITMDSEKSKTFVATYEFKTLALAEAALEQMIANTLEATATYGLARSKGTDINYAHYTKHTVEFPSDNIDIMGRYPSFSFGIVKNTNNPVVLEVMINEPLWK